MSFLSLQINVGTSANKDWQNATLQEDVQIHIEHVSGIWDTSNGGGAYSYEFRLPVEENLHILGNSCEMTGKSLYDQLYGKQFRLYAGGLCMFYGIIQLDDAVEVEEDDDGKHSIDITLNADNYEWDKLLEGVNARDVELATTDTEYITCDNIRSQVNVLSTADPDRNIKIGYCVPSYFPMYIKLYGNMSDKPGKEKDNLGTQIPEPVNTGFYINKMLLVQGREAKSGDTVYHEAFDFTNVDKPYPEAKFCNMTICYQHYAEGNDNTWTPERGYGVGKHTRINSAPCFYVLYWLDLLMQDLGIDVKTNALKNYEDLRRLAFYHTDSHYAEIPEVFDDPIRGQKVSGRRLLPGGMVINSDHIFESETLQESDYPDKMAFAISVGPISDNTIWPVDDINGVKRIDYHVSGVRANYMNVDKIEKETALFNSTYLYEAYATSENFPDADAKEIIEGLQNGFGARFLYNAEDGSLRIVFVKDILNQTAVHAIQCNIHKVTKTENHVTGFRIKYANTEDVPSNALTLKDDLTWVKQGTEGGDTTYSYNDYTNPCMLTPDENGEYKGYAWLLRHVTPYDKKCYLHPATGNGFRIKVDGDSNGGNTMFPSLFEVGQFQPAEWGNCSNTKDNKEFVEEITVGFAPVVENDLNSKEEALFNPDNPASAPKQGQSLATLVAGEIHSYTTADTGSDGYCKEGEFIHASVNFEMPITSMPSFPTKYAAERSDQQDQRNRIAVRTPITMVNVHMIGLETWDMASEEPTQTNDSGFMLGIMRGSGSSAHTEEYDDNYDGIESNSKWMVFPGMNPAFTADNIDQYGNWYDYNGGLPIKNTSSVFSRGEVVNMVGQLYPRSHASLTATARKNVVHYGSEIKLVGEGRIIIVAHIQNPYTGYEYYAEVNSNAEIRIDHPELLTPIPGDEGTPWITRYYYPYYGKVRGYALLLTTTDDGVTGINNSSYVRKLEEGFKANQNLFSLDIDTNKVLVDIYDTYEEAQAAQRLLESVGRILFDVSEGQLDISAEYEYLLKDVAIEGNGLGYKPKDSISLRLRAEKPNPGYDKSCKKKGYIYLDEGRLVRFPNGEVVPNTKYFPIGSSYAKRGLGDKFYSEYAHWVLHRKIANISCDMELAELVNIDMTKKYRLFGKVGFIKQISYSLDNVQGLSAVDIEFYYL